MKRCLGLALLFAVGCASTPKPEASTDPVQPDPIAQSFETAPNAGEWLVNPNHTLRGLSPDHAVQLLTQLNQAGAVEIRLGDIQPDASDPTFQSAGRLLIQMPRSEGARKGVEDFLRNRNVAVPDTSQRIIDVEIAQLPVETPSN